MCILFHGQRFTIKNARTNQPILTGNKQDFRKLIVQNKRHLAEADLIGADLQALNLCGANLKRASLMNALLQGTNLSHSNLQNANLDKADLWLVDLRGANLKNANLRDSHCENVIIDASQKDDLLRALGVIVKPE